MDYLATSVIIAVVAIGFYYSYGVFFEDLQDEFNSTRASIAIVSSIMTFSQNIMAFATGWSVDKYGPRITIAAGGILFFVLDLSQAALPVVYYSYISF